MLFYAGTTMLILLFYWIPRTSIKKHHTILNLWVAALVSQAAFIIINAALVILVLRPQSGTDFFLEYFRMDGDYLFLRLGLVFALFTSTIMYLIDRVRLSKQMTPKEKSKNKKELFLVFIVPVVFFLGAICSNHYLFGGIQ